MTYSHDDYSIGWICALPLEMAAAKAMLDKPHPRLAQPPHDHNTYALGEVLGHNVVIACLPSGVVGTASAAAVAAQMLSTYPRIRFGLMVGVGGGVPSADNDVRLGDVIVSNPGGEFGGVVQYDYGKAIREGRLQRTGMLNKPPNVVLTAVSELQSNHLMGMSQIPHFFRDMLVRFPGMTRFGYPDHTEDILFESSYEHRGGSRTCRGCDPKKVISRGARVSKDPRIHYGLIASGNQAVKSAVVRDKLGAELGALCLEMEAAGLMDGFPCLVIRGVSDYADSHKNSDWQAYAAAVAAAYAKELLSCVSVSQTENIPNALDAGIDINSLDPSVDDDRDKIYRLFRKSLPEGIPARDESTEEPLKVTMLKEILTAKFHAQGPWDIWLERYAVDGYNLNVSDGWGRTPLHYAVEAQRSRADKVRKLLDKGANPTMLDYQGNTPVDLARQSGDIAVLTLLLRAWLAIQRDREVNKT
ncbi:nucleoside phosphorylase domain-containing protein [Aspergillus pseudodeflectus]|uniref:Nucleoside phosphorylase domain-containing protein n=1 Tax=Aspergillus pseudodeflectus TaxID=176178 RepID=A0ABR4K5Q6_9EURO